MTDNEEKKDEEDSDKKETPDKKKAPVKEGKRYDGGAIPTS